MSTRTRREKDFAAREQMFVNAAHQHICEHGILGLQMARIARGCDYATGTLYQHFASKEDLLLAVCAGQADDRVAVFCRARDWDAPSRDQMFALAVGDMLFARRNPEHFRLAQYVFTEAVWKAASAHRRQAVMDANRPIGDIVATIVGRAIAAGDLDGRHRAPLELALGQWALTVGFHNLAHAEGVLSSFALHEPYLMLMRHAHLNLNGLGWQPLLDPFDDELLNDRINLVCDSLFRDLTGTPRSQAGILSPTSDSLQPRER